MNWEAIGVIGEICGALAVVASLFYLATQMRQNNRLLVLESRKYATASIFDVVDMVLQDQTIIDLMLKPRNELNDSEKARLLLLGRRMIISIQQGYNNNVDERDQLSSIAKAMYHREGMNYGLPDIWDEHKVVLQPDFVDWFESTIVNPG